MATAPAYRSFGTTLKYGAILVGGWKTMTLPGTDINYIDSTAQDTAGGWKTYLAGLRDGGTFTFAGQFSPTDVGQAAIITGEAEAGSFTVTFATGAGIYTIPVITGPIVVENGLDETINFTCSCKVTGPVVWSASA